MANAYAFHPTLADPIDSFREAERLLGEGREEEAATLYATCRTDPALTSVALIRLGEIANRKGLAREAYQLLHKAFELEPNLASRLVPDDDANFSFSYSRQAQQEVSNCPLCGGPGLPHGAYVTVTNPDFIPGFEPVRLWLRCDSCHHLFASEFPENIGDLLSSGCPEHHQFAKADLLPTLAPIVGRLRSQAVGNRFLEVGVGGGELAALALEFLFEVEGLDIRPAYADAVRERLGIPVHALDFMSFEPGREFDVICMGDVIEHIADPVSALTKAYRLLEIGGVLWLSTPNFESAFSRLVKDVDPMWRVVEHLNYFSYRSAKLTLERIGFEVFDYHVSKHYFGSMEISARKVR